MWTWPQRWREIPSPQKNPYTQNLIPSVCRLRRKDDMQVAIIRDDGWIESVNTSSKFRCCFQSNSVSLDVNKYDPNVYKNAFLFNDFLKFAICIKKAVVYKKPHRVVVRLRCNKCNGYNNSVCFRSCRFLPYDGNRIILYTSVYDNTCTEFESIRKEA